jgi:threonyl-tRNA synthetase
LTDQWNYILVVGEKEEAAGTVDVTDRDNQKKRMVLKVEEVHKLFQSLLPKQAEMYKQFYAKAWKSKGGDSHSHDHGDQI